MTLTEKYNAEDCFDWKDNRKIVVLNDSKGGKSTYRGENPDENLLILFRIDGGIMKNATQKQCDFGLYNGTTDSIRFVELKGSDCTQAIRQISQTIDSVLDHTVTCPAKVYGRIVLSRARTPELNTAEEYRLKKKLIKMKGDLKIQSGKMKETID